MAARLARSARQFVNANIFFLITGCLFSAAQKTGGEIITLLMERFARDFNKRVLRNVLKYISLYRDMKKKLKINDSPTINPTSLYRYDHY